MTNYIYVSVFTNYVSLAGKHIPPFDTWENAATNIIDAINYASDYSVILVTNGIYYIDSSIPTEKSLFLKSLNGPEITIIDGQKEYSFGKYRYIDGFKLINGTLNVDHSGVVEVNGQMQDCIVYSNNFTGYYGGGVYVLNGILENCLIFNNQLNFDIVLRGGTIVNCTVRGSVLSYADDGVVKNSIVDSVSGCYYPFHYVGYTKCYYSCINNFEEYGENIIGNIQTNDFGFVDASNNNYRLLETSPCVDSGSNAYVISDWDLDGNPRTNGGTVNMGAYESIPEPIFIQLFMLIVFCRVDIIYFLV